MSGAYGTLNVTDSNLDGFVAGTTYNVTIDEGNVVSVTAKDEVIQPGEDAHVDTGTAEADEVAGPVDSTTQVDEASTTPATE